VRDKRQRMTSKEKIEEIDKLYVASHWELIWRKFKKHRLASIGMAILLIFYFIGTFCEFVSPYDPHKRNSKYLYVPPQRIHFFDNKGEFCLRPFVYSLNRTLDPRTMQRRYAEDTNKKNFICFFMHGDRYKLWNLLEGDIHLVGVKEGVLFLFGTDKIGRDLLSRNIYASRISLSIGLVGVSLSFVIGCLLGGVSGYFGGMTDVIIQRVIELLLSLPQIPLWMALSAALPPEWEPIKVYFGITIILSLVGWTQIARVVRGKILSLRKEDYVMAAVTSGARSRYIITKHLLPGFLSYIIVSLTLAIPQMILAETALSFLGLGLQHPAISWGVLLQDAQSVRSVAIYPWLLIPSLFVIVTVLAFNFLGDGLRDAADPYK